MRIQRIFDRSTLKDCFLGLFYALLICLVLYYSYIDNDGFRYLEL